MSAENRHRSFARLRASRIRHITWALSMAMSGLPALGIAVIDERDFLPDVVQHLDRANVALESGQYSIAAAHARVILHDQGLKVYVDTSGVPQNQLADCLNAAQKSVRYWNGILGPGPIFTLVEQASEADVKVVFQPTVVLEGVQVGGYCANTRSVTANSAGQATASFKATIFARYLQPNGQPMMNDQLLNVITHEMGHIFGLNDTTRGGRLMGPLNLAKPRFELAPEELSALRELRKTASEIRQKALSGTKGSG